MTGHFSSLHLITIVATTILVGLAAAGLVGGSGGSLRRVRSGLPESPRSGRGVSVVIDQCWRRLCVSRPDAVDLRHRAALAVGSGVTVWLLGTLNWPTHAGVALAAGLIGAALCFGILGRVESPQARRRRQVMIIELPHLLDLLAACLRAGLPLRYAVRQVVEVCDGPLADDLDQVIRQVELGVAEPDAWRGLRDHPVLGTLAVDLARSVDSGTRLAHTLTQHARDARRRRRGALEARAKTVGVHSVPPLMVCFLPAFLLIGVVPTGVSAFLHALG